jgi:hypothetical protein
MRGGVVANQAPEQAARQLVTAYFEAWSSPNARAIQAMPEFYGRTVTFHGRTMSRQALMKEKRRFVRRWPDRTYRLRPETLEVLCAPSGQSCTVRSDFTFDATGPSGARHAKGSGKVEFVVDVSGDPPIIMSEASIVRNRQAKADPGPTE